MTPNLENIFGSTLAKTLLEYYNDLAAIFFYYNSKIAHYLMAEDLSQQSRTMKNIAKNNS